LVTGNKHLIVYGRITGIVLPVVVAGMRF